MDVIGASLIEPHVVVSSVMAVMILCMASGYQVRGIWCITVY